MSNLLKINEIKKHYQVEICRILGYKKDVFSKIQSGHSYGSPQLLAAMDLLIYKLANEEKQELERQKVDDQKRFARLNELMNPPVIAVAKPVNYFRKRKSMSQLADAEVRQFLDSKKDKGAR